MKTEVFGNQMSPNSITLFWHRRSVTSADLAEAER